MNNTSTPVEAHKRVAEETLANPGKAACQQQVIEAPAHDPVSQSEAELTIGPEYTEAVVVAEAKEGKRAAGVAEGAVHKLTMESVDCKLYPGVARKHSNKEVDDWIEDPRFRGLGLTPEI